MSLGSRRIQFSQRPGPDELAQGALAALREGRSMEAVEYSLVFAAEYSGFYPEAHVLCAMALARAGCAEASLAQWDKAVQSRPQRVEWLTQALRAAWDMEKTSELAAVFSRQWLTLLERVFIAAPPPDLLAQLAARGWCGTGAAGMHLGRLRAWLWLPERETFRIQISSGGPQFSLGTVRKMTLASHAIYTLDTAIPAANTLFFISITDASGRHAHGSPLPCCTPNSALPSTKIKASGKRQRSGVTIIVPVYDDIKATLSCLASVIVSRKRSQTPSAVLVMWDHGPDPKLLAALRRLAARKKITLCETPANMGFLGCVNHALSLVPQGDVILLNADTLVHGDWIDRMALAALTPDAGTVTALGSEAELVSFPSPAERGDIRRLRDVRILDDACRALSAGDSLKELPVGVGFCMAVTRRALDKIGGFDGLRLFNGYGEEVDFCLRAKKAGLKNYAAMNVFVAHLGGRSFGYAKKALAAQNNAALLATYPYYKATYEAFMTGDSLRSVREKISIRACPALPPDTVLHVHAWSDMHLPVIDAAQEDAKAGKTAWAALFMLPCGGATRAMLRIRHTIPLADMYFRLPEDAETLRSLARQCRFAAVRQHSRSIDIHATAAILDLPVEEAPLSIIAPLPTFSPTGGTCLVEPPRNVTAWKRLCRFAAEHDHTVFWVHCLKKLWGDAPRPANMRALPELENLNPLAPAALLLMDGVDLETKNGWQRWLSRHGVTGIPLFTLPEEAA